MFCHKVALPLRDGEPPILRAEPSAELVTITRKSVACGIGCVVMLVTFPPCLYSLYRSDKERQRAHEQTAESAPAEWEHGEDGAKSAAALSNHDRSGTLPPRVRSAT